MSQATVVFPCVMDAQLAVRRASQQLCASGYQVEERHPGEARCELRYVKGAANAVTTAEHRHHLDLRADGRELTFVFTAGLAASGFVTKAEREVLEARARAALEATAEEEAKPARVGCKQCGQLTDTTATACASCGSPDFF